MKAPTRFIALSTLLMGALWQISAQAEPTSSSSDGYTLKVPKSSTNSMTLASNEATSKSDDSSLGLKIGSKNNIQLYGTVEIGYSKWSKKN